MDLKILEGMRKKLESEILIKKGQLKKLDLEIIKKKWPFEPGDRIKDIRTGEIRVFAKWMYQYNDYRPMAFKIKKNGESYQYPNEIWFMDFDNWEKE